MLLASNLSQNRLTDIESLEMLLSGGKPLEENLVMNTETSIEVAAN